MNKRTTRFVGLALAESARSTYERVQIGTVIARGKTLLSKGANLATSHPLQMHWNDAVGRISPRHNLHSEMHAIVQAHRQGVNLRDTEVYVARVDRNNNLAHCRPCPACQAALESVGVLSVVYSTPSGFVTEHYQ